MIPRLLDIIDKWYGIFNNRDVLPVYVPNKFAQFIYDSIKKELLPHIYHNLFNELYKCEVRSDKSFYPYIEKCDNSGLLKYKILVYDLRNIKPKFRRQLRLQLDKDTPFTTKTIKDQYGKEVGSYKLLEIDPKYYTTTTTIWWVNKPIKSWTPSRLGHSERIYG